MLDFGNRDKVGSVLRTKHNDFSDDSRTLQACCLTDKGVLWRSE